jgi:hypothetical protein
MTTVEEKWTLYKRGRFPKHELADLVHDLGESALLNRDAVREELIKLMSSPDPIVRQNALGALAYHGLAVDWSTEFGKQLLSAMDVMLRLDEDRDCRRQAAASFGSLFKSARHAGVISALGRVCSATDEEDDVRAFAYVSLLKVVGIHLREQHNPVGLKLRSTDLTKVSDLIAEFGIR